MVAMDHEDALETSRARSIALHAEVARRLAEDPALVERAKARVRRWLVDGNVARPWAVAWQAWLDLPLTELCARLVERSDEAQDLRQVSPFAGVLDARTRWRVLRGATR